MLFFLLLWFAIKLINNNYWIRLKLFAVKLYLSDLLYKYSIQTEAYNGIINNLNRCLESSCSTPPIKIIENIINIAFHLIFDLSEYIILINIKGKNDKYITWEGINNFIVDCHGIGENINFNIPFILQLGK